MHKVGVLFEFLETGCSSLVGLENSEHKRTELCDRSTRGDQSVRRSNSSRHTVQLTLQLAGAPTGLANPVFGCHLCDISGLTVLRTAFTWDSSIDFLGRARVRRHRESRGPQSWSAFDACLSAGRGASRCIGRRRRVCRLRLEIATGECPGITAAGRHPAPVR